MKSTTIALWLTVGLAVLAVVPTIILMAREALRRRAVARALLDAAEARRLIGDAEIGSKDAILALQARFKPETVERAVLELLRSEDAARAKWGGKVFGEMGLAEAYGKRLREASKWSERAHAAEILGLAGVSSAVPALVASLRDKNEDEVSVKVAAAGALARLREETAVPLLVKELGDADERAARTVSEALSAFGTVAVPELLACLNGDTAAATRVWAARILGTIGDTRATDDLVARLYDRDDRLRMAAAEALGGIKDPRALQSLVRATLRDPAPQVRAHAAFAVSAIEGPRALDVMVAALADPDYGTRIRALEAFETMRLDDTAPLEAALRDPNLEVRRRAALALERVGYLEKIVGELTAPDRPTRDRAYHALLEIGRVGLADSVASYVHHVSFEVRAIAAKACGELGSARVANILVSALDDPEWPVRAAAAEALGRVRTEKAPEKLVAHLTDASEMVREACADALTNYAKEEVEPHLLKILAAYDAGTITMRTSMVILTTRLGGDAADELLVRASSDPSDAVRLRAVTALGDREGRVLVEPLVARLTDASLEVRMAAVTALGAATSREAFEGLLHALGGAAPDARDRIADALSRGARGLLFERLPELEKSADLDVRLGLAWTLGKTGAPEAVPALARFLRDKSAVLRASAAGALAKIPTEGARDALLGSADDPDGRVRAAVVNALGRAPEATEPILGALKKRARDPDPFVRDRALVALARVGGERAWSDVRMLAHEAEEPARAVAFALAGTDASLGAALDLTARPGALGAIGAFLAKGDPAVRKAFFEKLHLEDVEGAEAGDQELLPRYEQVLRASLDVSARRLAVTALARLEGPRAIEVLGDAAAGDPDEAIRGRAVAALAPHASDRVARSALVRALADPSVAVVRGALDALVGRDEPEVARALAKRLGAVPDELAGPFEAALAELHREDPFPFLDWMMGNDVPELLVPAVRVLGRIAHPMTLPVLQQLTQSRSAALRTASVHAVSKVPGAEAAAVALQLAQDPSEDVRVAVLEATTWTKENILQTANLRRDPSVRVRTTAASSLARAMGGNAEKSALRALEGMLEDGSPRVRASALVSLVAAGKPEGLAVFGRLFPALPLDVRMELRDEARAATVTEALAHVLASSADPEGRRVAVVAMGALGASGFHSHALSALSDPSPPVRTAAVQALAQLDDDRVRARLRELLADPDPAVREAARKSLIRTVG